MVKKNQLEGIVEKAFDYGSDFRWEFEKIKEANAFICQVPNKYRNQEIPDYEIKKATEYIERARNARTRIEGFAEKYNNLPKSLHIKASLDINRVYTSVENNYRALTKNNEKRE